MPFERKKIIGYLAGIFAALFWGFDTVVIRWIIHEGVSPFLVGISRLIIGSATLSIIVVITNIVRKKSLFPRIHYSPFFWLITISLALNFILFHKGLSYTIASNAVLIEAFSPVAVLIIVMLFLPGRIAHLIKPGKLPQKVLQIVVIGSIGSSLLLINDPKDFLTSNNVKLIGDIMEFIAMFAWAFVMLGMHEYQQREERADILGVTAQFLFLAAFLLAPFTPWYELMHLSSMQWIWLIILGVFSTGAAYALWHIASKYLDIFPLMTIFNLVSIFTVITESYFLGLQFSWKLFAGGIMILYAAMHAKWLNEKYRLLEKEIPPAE